VLVASIGAGGAIVIDRDGPTRFRAPTVKVRSSVGAGDSMVAGLAVGIQRRLSVPEAVSLGVAAGTATVLTEGTGLCRPEDVADLLGAVAVG
jgi:6-phosphofructokinase 2